TLNPKTPASNTRRILPSNRLGCIIEETASITYFEAVYHVQQRVCGLSCAQLFGLVVTLNSRGCNLDHMLLKTVLQIEKKKALRDDFA
ncbi:MAG: hypothetical protein ACPIOQ_81515, partial [Promethearchaeia archaeon]